MEMTYEQLVCYLKKKASTNTDAVGIFLEDLSSRETATIINNNSKEYNRVYIVIGPAGMDEARRNSSEASYYYCENLKEAQEIGEYLINSSSSWIIEINPEDMLEQIYDR